MPEPDDLAELRADAERFRWLAGTEHARLGIRLPVGCVMIETSRVNLPKLREAIDAARAQWPHA